WICDFPQRLGAAGNEGTNLTPSLAKLKDSLGLSDQELREAIHALKQGIEGNPDLTFDWQTGDVFDQRSMEWLGNLFDEVKPRRPCGVCKNAQFRGLAIRLTTSRSNNHQRSVGIGAVRNARAGC